MAKDIPFRGYSKLSYISTFRHYQFYTEPYQLAKAINGSLAAMSISKNLWNAVQLGP